MKRIIWSCVAGVIALACGSGGSNGSGSTEGGENPKCESLFDEAQCSVVCESDAECALGLHCAAGTCDAECSGSAGCDGGRVCSARGRCESGISIEPGAMGGSGPDCAYADVAFEKEHPNVVLLIDQSGSMEEALG